MKEIEFYGRGEIMQLDSGLEVLLKPLEYARSVAMQLWFRVGALYENETNSGLSHYLEHMLFKGTEKYSPQQVNRLIEEVGGRQNAATSQDYTKYHVTLPADRWQRGLELLSQLCFHPQLPEDEFEKERRVVLSELDRYSDQPDKILWKQFIPRLYHDHPYERLVIGSREVLESVSYSDLLSYYEKFYAPQNATLIIAGDFDREALMNQVKQLFESLESKGDLGALDFPAIKKPLESGMKRVSGRVNQVYGVLGTPGYPADDERIAALDLLMEILGGGPASRLYEKLVLREELASTLTARFWTQRESGPLVVRFRCEPEATGNLMEAIYNEMKALAKTPPTERELERSRVQLKTDVMFSAQTAAGQANQLGYGRVVESFDHFAKYLRGLEKATAEQLREISRELLDPERWTGVLLEPEEGE